jgi:phosphate transport system ATP-binding protein
MSAMYDTFAAVKAVTLSFASNQVHALIGPSGCGKSTFLRTINRLHELSIGGWVTGQVLLDEVNIYAPEVSVIQLRRRVGMVFQKPTPFPTKSIYDNVAAGLLLEGRRPKSELDDIVEESLRRAALWDEVKDRLHGSAIALSGGQQQRLCVARTIAPQPEVVLLDEPTASLDPQGTQHIEELVFELKQAFTIIIVTHNMQQAARVSDTTTFFYLGEMIEHGPTGQIFTNPAEAQTEAYITGRFG